jgi:hypothetical protein
MVSPPGVPNTKASAPSFSTTTGELLDRILPAPT